jgi:hypothetical protein
MHISRIIDPSTSFKVLASRKLITWYPEGVLDFKMASKMVDLVTYHELMVDGPFHRFADWTSLTGAKLNFDEVTGLAAKRREEYGNGPRVKSAFVVENSLAYGIAFVFAVLMKGSPITVKVFRNTAEAAKWLRMSPRALRRD